MQDQKFIKENKEKLLSEKKHLEALLSRVAVKDQVGGDYHPKFLEIGNTPEENAAEVTAFEINLAEEYDLAEKLRKVDAALKRIAGKTYGACLLGGEEISRQRLEAIPEAENCVEHEKPSP